MEQENILKVGDQFIEINTERLYTVKEINIIANNANFYFNKLVSECGTYVYSPEINKPLLGLAKVVTPHVYTLPQFCRPSSQPICSCGAAHTSNPTWHMKFCDLSVNNK